MDKFSNNGLQFARLLTELVANVDFSKERDSIAESMDLTLNELDSLFARADNYFTAMKNDPPKVTEIGKVSVQTPSGDSTELAILYELGTNNIFAVEGSYVEQDFDVESPYGNGLLEWSADQVKIDYVSLSTDKTVEA